MMRKQPKTSPAVRRARRRKLLLEHLEPRDLLATGTWSLEGTSLIVHGTERNDTVLLTARSGNVVTLTLNGQRSHHSAIERIVVYGGAGNDTIRGDSRLTIPLELRGGQGRDYVVGGGGNDQLFGGAGHDRLYGEQGHDVMRGGAGNDQLFGGAGQDQLLGGNENDTLVGNAGADELQGNNGHDALYGDAGHDLLQGGPGKDRVRGGNGNDAITGDAGDDELHGEAGTDLLIGGFGRDWIEGHDGNDVLVGGATVYDADATALRLLQSSSHLLAGGADVRLDATTLYSDGPDTIFGQSGNDRLFHGPEDLLRGSAHGDVKTLVSPQAAGANHAVTTDRDVQQSPSVAVNPSNAQHVVVAYMDYSLVPTGYAGIGVATSFDGGTSWNRTSIALPNGFQQGAASPIVKFDDQGRVYVSFMAATYLEELPPLTNPDVLNPERMASDRVYGNRSNNGLFVSRSDDGGMHWNAPVAVVSHLYQGTEVPLDLGPDLAIDTFPLRPDGKANPHYGNLYVSWVRFYPAGGMPGKADTSDGGSEIMIAFSDDGGQHWEVREKEKEFWNDTNRDGTRQDVEVSTARIGVFDFFFREFTGAGLGTGYFDYARVTVGPAGDVYVGGWTGGAFAVVHSTDAAASFALPTFEGSSANAQLAFGVNFETQPGDRFPNNQFRTQSVRAVAADLTRPGSVYAVELMQVKDANGVLVDEADVFLARSENHGFAFDTSFQVGAHITRILNDDNAGVLATNAEDDVISGQGVARVAVDAEGNLSVIWYDTRRDPENHRLEVFGTVSHDGGRTFSPNFRITDTSFDANAGSFLDAVGQENFYLGDFLGLATADGTAYAAWTDTRNGNQDIYFSKFSTERPPAPLNDRFEPNNGAAAKGSATQVGAVIERALPKLTIEHGDEDWFAIESVAAGELAVSATHAEFGNRVRLELWNRAGTTRLANGATILDEQGRTIGTRVAHAADTGQQFLVRVLPVTGTSSTEYTLAFEALTADLGTQVHGTIVGSLDHGDVALYRMESAAAGALNVMLTTSNEGSGGLHLELLDADGQTVLASAGEHASASVRKAQTVLVRVTSSSAEQRQFTLEFTNTDQITTRGASTLFLPAGLGPSRTAAGYLNEDAHLDLVVSNALSNTISVLTGNGDGTFQAPRQFAIGAYVPQPADNRTPTLRRDIAIADLNHDGESDVIVTNEASSDVSVLLGRGDGTFEPHRRFDATPGPFSLDIGDVNNDDHLDIVAVNAGLGAPTVAILLGRGNGTFAPQQTFSIFADAANPIPDVRLARVNADPHLDLIISGDTRPGVHIFLGDGDGTFTFLEQFAADREGPEVEIGDIDSDGLLDLVVATNGGSGVVSVLLGDASETFAAPLNFFAGQGPVAVELVDFGSRLEMPDGSTIVGPPDGHVDLVVANSGLRRQVANVGDPGVVLLPGQFDEQGHFIGFGSPIPLSASAGPTDVLAVDANNDAAIDIAVVDPEGITWVFGKPPLVIPNNSLAFARDLGIVTHLVQPTLTIIPEHPHAYYRFTVPTEVIGQAGDQIVDISALVQHAEGAGIAVELLDTDGTVLATGERQRIRAAQGKELVLHVYGVTDNSGQTGSGAYTLAIDVLPQVATIESHALLPGLGEAPGGPTTSIVLTLQGDRLDLQSATDRNNYQVTWLGPDGQRGGGDDQQIPLSSNSQAVVYSPGANVAIGSGNTHPTEVRQSITLLFDSPLPAGSYEIALSPQIQTADFNAEEDGLLAGGAAFDNHPISQLNGDVSQNGVLLEARDLVFAAAGEADLSGWSQGTRFLAQLHDDLGSILDSILSVEGDDEDISRRLNDHIRERLAPAVNAELGLGILLVWLDPTPIALTDPLGNATVYDPQIDEVESEIPLSYIDVIGIVEVVAIITSGGVYDMLVEYAPPLARGGYVFVGNNQVQTGEFTEQLRSGESSFTINLP